MRGIIYSVYETYIMFNIYQLASESLRSSLRAQSPWCSKKSIYVKIVIYVKY